MRRLLAGPEKFVVAAFLLLLHGLYNLGDSLHFIYTSENAIGEVVATGRYQGRRKSFRARRYQVVRFTANHARNICVTFDDIT